MPSDITEQAELTPEQEGVESTDTVQVSSAVNEDTAAEEWSWKRISEAGEEIEASEDTFISENLATADAANANPGVMVHTPDVVARQLPEADAKAIREAQAPEED